MKAIVELFNRWTESIERRARERAEAYLAESADRYELEYRIRKLARRDMSRPGLWGTTLPAGF